MNIMVKEILLCLSVWFNFLMWTLYLNEVIVNRAKGAVSRYERRVEIKKILERAGLYPLFMYE